MSGQNVTLGELAEQTLRVVREAPVIAYDTEGSGLDWKRNQACGYVITTGDFNSYIPVRHGGGGNLNDPNCSPLREADQRTPTHQFEMALAKAFEERRQRKFLTIGHNLKFDMHFSANEGIILGRECEDTGLNAAMLDEYARSYSLDSCAKAAGVTAKLGQQLYDHLASLFGCKNDKTSMANFWRTSGQDPIAIDYAMGDGVSTLELREWQIKQIAAEDMKFIHRVESRLVYTVFRMERRGIKVSIDRIAAVEEEIKKRLDAAYGKLPKGFNSRAPSQVKKYLEDAGRTDWPMTEPSTRFPEGQPSFPEKWLKKFPEGKAIIDVRKLTNLGNSFITPLKERHIFNGRVHSEFNQLKSDEYGTISGRFSSSNPNMQQVPKRDKELGRLFRSIFVPDEGMEFYEADYSQCEPRLFAHYSKESALLDGYNRNPPVDMHDVVAHNFNCERDPTAKRMNMGILTGMQVDSFAGHMGWSRMEAQEKFNEWFDLFPGIKAFQDQVKGVFKSSGYVRSILKRRARLDHPRFAYRGVSRVIQMSNADVLKERGLACDEYLEELGDQTHMLLNCHDAYAWQAPLGAEGERQSAKLVELCCDVQGPPYSLRVPFIMDVGHGPDWGTATYGSK